MNPTSGFNWKRIARAAGTILSISLIILLLARQGWDEIISALTSIRLTTLAAATFLVLFSRLAVIGRWHSLLASAHIAIKILETAKITFAGLFASNFLPTTIGGDVIRIAEVAHIREKKAAYTASVVMDRGIGLLGMALFLPLGLVETINELDWSRQGIIFGPLLFGLGPTKPGARLRSVAEKYLVKPLAAFLQALKIWLRNPVGLFISLAFTLLHMFSRFFALWLIFRDQGELINVIEIASLWSLVYFITLIPISLNGLGLQELSTTFMYTQVAGLALPSVITAALLIRTLEMAASLPGALFLPGIIGDSKTEEG